MITSVALTIAGSDPSGGAGIQADLKTFHQFQVYGMSVISLITAQNTKSVKRIEFLDADLVADQLDAVLEDIQPDAIKTGALGSAGIVRCIVDRVKNFDGTLIVDPVALSSYGEALLTPEAREVVCNELLPLATLITPNLEEAEWLSGMRIQSKEDLQAMAAAIQKRGVPNVLIKGGHLPGAAVDYLLMENEEHWFEGERMNSEHTHGTGCTLSAAITALMARGISLKKAVGTAKIFVTQGIKQAPGLGSGCGPLSHFGSTMEF